MVETSDYRDFLAGLEAGSADLVLTDPPYNISRETSFAKGGVGAVAGIRCEPGPMKYCKLLVTGDEDIFSRACQQLTNKQLPYSPHFGLENDGLTVLVENNKEGKLAWDVTKFLRHLPSPFFVKWTEPR